MGIPKTTTYSPWYKQSRKASWVLETSKKSHSVRLQCYCHCSTEANPTSLDFRIPLSVSPKVEWFHCSANGEIHSLNCSLQHLYSSTVLRTKSQIWWRMIRRNASRPFHQTKIWQKCQQLTKEFIALLAYSDKDISRGKRKVSWVKNSEYWA